MSVSDWQVQPECQTGVSIPLGHRLERLADRVTGWRTGPQSCGAVDLPFLPSLQGSWPDHVGVLGRGFCSQCRESDHFKAIVTKGPEK